MARWLRMHKAVVAVLTILLAFSSYAEEQTHTYIEKELHVMLPGTEPKGLDVLEVWDGSSGKHPLALLTHGTSAVQEEREHVSAWKQLPQALWFARRGYVALMVVRRGYGHSGGQMDTRASKGCRKSGGFEAAGRASADDLRDVAQWAGEHLPEADVNTIVSVGISTGGFAQVALSAHPPAGLRAAISFAGGRGGNGKETNCNLPDLVSTFHTFGKDAAKHGAVPMLWIYSENDKWFTPSMAQQFKAAYDSAGGRETFIQAPPYREDGHGFYGGAIDTWTPMVEGFLREQHLLPLGDKVLPPPAIPDTPVPPGLKQAGTEAWHKFLAAGPYKAFATTGTGRWGFSIGGFTQDIADKKAIENCERGLNSSGVRCRIVARTPQSEKMEASK